MTTADAGDLLAPEQRRDGGRRTWPSLAFVAIALLAVLAAIAPGDGVAFRRSDRIAITSIRDGSIILRTPAEVAWSTDDADGVAGYVVVLDRSLQPTGAGLAHYVRGDDRCDGQRLPTCLAPDFLDDYHVYVATARHVTIELVPERGGSRSSRLRHEITVAPLDRFGRRIGDDTDTVRFFMPRRGS